MTPAETAALARSILDTHHALLHAELPRLAGALRGSPAEVRVPFARLRAVMDDHMMKEEQILFPRILALADGEGGDGCGLGGPIAQMRAEHEGIRAIEAELRATAHLAGPEAGALVALLDDLAEHARKEDEELFPAALGEGPAPAVHIPVAVAPKKSEVRREIQLQHLGYSGLRLTLAGASLVVDAPSPVSDPLVVTWTERERVAGARGASGPLAALPPVLEWLGRRGTALREGSVDFAGFRVAARPFRPIPYATPPEALRKTWSAFRHPVRAFDRLSFTVKRPDAPPLVLRVERGGLRVALLSQVLHRFVTDAELADLVAWVGPVNLAIAGTDYDDEEATGKMLAAFDAEGRVLADLTGSIRRTLGLPVRPLEVTLRGAPHATRMLPVDGQLSLGG